jgi:squalene-hopene/tetraprenyl-beta-curcumene cyclase
VPDDKGRKRSWAQDLGQRLVSIQRADGSWLNENGKYWEDNPVLVTSRALIALNSALRSAGANEKN